MNSKRMCTDQHVCANFACNKLCYCNTYVWACPWRNDDEEQLCSDCLAQLAKDMEAFENA